jgi:hypothetical protein
MALFLARTLAADGITPAVTGSFTFTPNGGQSESGDDLQITVGNAVAGVEHTIALLPTDNVDGVVFADTTGDANEADDIGNTDEGNTDITVVAGADVSDDTIQTVTPDGSTFTFTVDSFDDFDSFVVVVWADADGDEELDLNADNEPSETPFGVSGEFALIPDEGVLGEFYSGDLLYIDRDANFMVIDDGPVTLYYDDNDIYSYSGDFVMTMAQWEAWASTDAENDGYDPDYVDYDNFAYNPDPAGVSDFYLSDDYTAAPAAPTADVIEDDGDDLENDLEVTIVAPSNGFVDVDDYNLQICLEDDCTDGGDPVVSSAAAESGDIFSDLPDGDWFVRVQATTGENSPASEWSEATAFTIEAGTGPIITSATLETDAVIIGAVDSGDEFELVFDESMAALADGDQIWITDEDGDIVKFEYDTNAAVTAGNTAATFALSTTDVANDTITVTVDADPTDINLAGDDDLEWAGATVTATAGITDLADGVETNLDDSTDVAID